MALTPGTRLGAYEIHSALGAGGMGEVYRATDTRLKRDVALKVLLQEVVQNRDRLARFEREAQILASLNHPNIAAIHGVEQVGDTTALVLEYIDGPTLAECIAPGPIPLHEALPIARQIAEALEAAHEQGIIHRDLKPANIKVRPDGTVKVLDFGLAKVLDPAHAGASDSNLSNSPTVTSPDFMTGVGVLLGTAAYMSPEQVKGKAADKRSDIWAFGCVLFEMLSGCCPFAGETVADCVAATLERDPDWTRLPAATPLTLRTLLERCLAKDRQRRLRDIGDARLALDEAAASTPLSHETSRPAMPRRLMAIAGALLAIAAIVAVAITFRQRQPASGASAAPPEVRFAVTAPAGYQLDVNRSPVGVSPDGRSIAFAAFRGNTQQVFVRNVDQVEAAAIPGSEGGFAPFFSPDGQWIGFFAKQKIRKVLRSGGAPVAIADFSELAGNRSVSASWDEPDTIYYTPDVSKGIWRVSAGGGIPVEVTKPGPRDSFHLWPQLLPGGKALLFSAIDDGREPQAYVQRLDTGERKALVRGQGTRYVPSGNIVFVQGGSLIAAPFDVSRFEVTGSPVAVVPDVMPPFRLRTMASGFNRLFDVSSTGTLAFLSGGRPPMHALVWVDRNGREEPTGASGGTYAQPRLSPDGRRVAVVVRGDDFHDVWLYDLTRSTWDRFTQDGNSEFPLWTADGTRLVYNTDRTGAIDIEWKPADGSGASETIVARELAPRMFPFSWSPDGALALVALTPAQDIYVVRPGTKAVPFVATQFVEGSPMFAPDGRSIAYVASDTGQNEVYLRPFPGPGERLKVSQEGGNEPVWSPSGRELFFRTGDALMAVDVSAGPRLSLGTPHRLWEKHYEPTLALYPNYSTIDGQHFLMVKRIDADDKLPVIDVTVGWTDELRRRVGAR